MARYTEGPGVDPAAAAYAEYLEGLAPSTVGEHEPEPVRADYPSGLDGHPIGEPRIGDINGLSRTNYFNGRYLDAEALRRDQVYFARRDRVVAQTEHAGIAWGLGLEYDSWQIGSENPFTSASQIVLRPGVAFDGEGRPIVVDRAFGFTLAELLTEYALQPSRAARPTSRFQPCICVERLPGNEDVGPEHETGAYLLVISPTSREEGSARVYRDPCARDLGVHCDADAWRHAFRLSLVRYDTFQHELFEIGDRCQLRGLLAAHYFDIWEHDLRERWRPPFGEDNRFCQGLGPFQRAPGAVALAMCFVTTNGDVNVFDPWIPRRYQISSASRAWEAAVRGAPTPTASVSRRHQFQCQLAECAPGRDGRPNLRDIGFRHMAPCGFLPFDLPNGSFADREARWRGLGDGLHEAERIRAVRDLVDPYFSGTNLMPRYRVALYEDEIFSEMDRAAELDPIVVQQGDPLLWNLLSEWFLSVGYDGARLFDPFRKGTDLGWEGRPFSDLFAGLICGDTIMLEQIVNRELELIDVIIPLFGRRLHNRPVPISPELRAFTEEYGVDLEGATDVLGDSISAREFVFFVKRRALMDDWIYIILDALLDLMALMKIFFDAFTDGANNDLCGRVKDDTTNDQPGASVVEESLQPGYMREGDRYIETRELVEANNAPRGVLFESPEVRSFLGAAVARSRPELRNAGLIDSFDEIAAARAATYENQGLSAEDAQARGRYEAIDVMLEEYPAFADYKVIAALDPRLLDAVHTEVRDRAEEGTPIAVEVFNPQKTAALEPKVAAIYRAARASFGAEMVTVGDETVSRNKVLLRSEKDLIASGGTKKIADETTKLGRKLERATLRVAKSNVAGPKLAKAYEEAVIKVGEDKALATLAKKSGYKTVAADLVAIRDVIGTDGLDSMINTMRKY